MDTKKSKKVIIGTLCAIVIGMVVGYAALSQILTITGTSGITGDFKIEFTKIAENTMVNSKTITTGGIGSTTANFTVDLEKPGSSAIYDLTVENKGTIDAVLTGIEGIDEINLSEPLDIVYSIIGIEEGDSLNVGEQKSFQVKVVWNSSATSLPETSKTLNLKLNYEQKSGSGEEEGTLTAGDYLIKNKLNTAVAPSGSGLVPIGNNGEIVDSTSPREYRYIGPNPDNYVQFNNELWRIIGIFDGQLKIIRKDSLGDMMWNENGANDWTTATLQTYLNGEFYNSIDSISQEMIFEYTWKLGGTKTYQDVIAQTFYERERGSDVYPGNSSEWLGKIALMYVSDYGFSTSGGGATNRSSCLTKKLYSWDNSCFNNSWIYYNGERKLTLTTDSSRSNYAISLWDDGTVESYDSVDFDYGVYPSLYLKDAIKIISGTGTEIDPFILG